MPTLKTMQQTPANDEVPVNRGMLFGVRTELIERIDNVDAKVQQVDAKVQQVDAKVQQVDAKVQQVDAKVQQVDAKVQQVDAKVDALRAELKAEIHDVKAGMARIEVLVEEQNARNKVVLDGMTALFSRQDQVERRVDHVEDTVRALAAGRPIAVP